MLVAVGDSGTYDVLKEYLAELLEKFQRDMEIILANGGVVCLRNGYLPNFRSGDDVAFPAIYNIVEHLVTEDYSDAKKKKVPKKPQNKRKTPKKRALKKRRSPATKKPRGIQNLHGAVKDAFPLAWPVISKIIPLLGWNKKINVSEADQFFADFLHEVCEVEGVQTNEDDDFEKVGKKRKSPPASDGSGKKGGKKVVEISDEKEEVEKSDEDLEGLPEKKTAQRDESEAQKKQKRGGDSKRKESKEENLESDNRSSSSTRVETIEV